MRARVLLLLALLIGLAFTAIAEQKSEPEAKKEEPAKSKDEPEIKDEAAPEDDKSAPYFTQETLKELARMDEFKNNKLWACHLLSSCKLKLEQVLFYASNLRIANLGWDNNKQGTGTAAIYEDLHGHLVKLLRQNRHCRG